MDTGVFMCGVDDKMVITIIVQPEIENGTRECIMRKNGRQEKTVISETVLMVVSVVCLFSDVFYGCWHR